MSLIGLLVFILVLVLLFWLAGMIPDARGQKIAQVAIIIFAVIYLLSAFGILGSMNVRLR